MCGQLLRVAGAQELCKPGLLGCQAGAVPVCEPERAPFSSAPAQRRRSRLSLCSSGGSDLGEPFSGVSVCFRASPSRSLLPGSAGCTRCPAASACRSQAGRGAVCPWGRAKPGAGVAGSGQPATPREGNGVTASSLYQQKGEIITKYRSTGYVIVPLGALHLQIHG